MAAPWLERRWNKLNMGRGVGTPPSGGGGGRGRGGRGGGRGNGNGNGTNGLETTTLVATSETSTGNQDITSTGFGTPTGAIFIYTIDTDETDTTSVNGLGGSFGAIDGTNERVVAFASQFNVSTSATKRRATNDSVIMEIDPDDGSVLAEAAFVEFITDGVRINWSAVTGSAFKFTVVLLKGESISLHVGSSALTTEDNSITITPDFQMSAGIFFSVASTPFDDTAGSNAAIHQGFASYDGSTIRQTTGLMVDINGASLADPRAVVRNDAVYPRLASGGDFAEITSVTSTEVEITSRGIDMSNITLGYILIGGLENAWAGVLDTPTETGVNSWTDPGFQPTIAFLCTTRISDLDTLIEDFQAGSWGLSVITAADQLHSSWYSEDATGVMDTASQLVNSAVNLKNDEANQNRIIATFDSFTANGLDLNFTGADGGTSRKWPALFLS